MKTTLVAAMLGWLAWGCGDNGADDGSVDARQIDGVVQSDATAACNTAAAAIGAEMVAATPSACASVVRLAHDSLDILGWQLFCGAYHGLSEGEARSRAQDDAGYGGGSADLLLGAPPPTGGWVFYRSPGDFGGTGVVDVRNGLAVFGGSIVWDGAGDITYPATWRPASDLASGCPTSGGIGAVSGWDLVDGTAIDAGQAAAAAAVVAQTALPTAAWSGGYGFETTVLRYPRSVGELNPATAEWIVVFHSGWLE